MDIIKILICRAAYSFGTNDISKKWGFCMTNDINIVFFDLFFTLVTPKYSDLRNENDILGITKEEWERYAENEELYLKRATNKNISPKQIIEDIINKMKIDINI
ncbi:hypothetical protein [Clostridium chromiireducens]|uniref:Uncharacterized protein n=2 Tax=Clostridium chromiireducens TaxID=225345 RepID=A0A1V4II52_9CLOT|nr:hypothetical protein [Clostridium chromiireducens]OPJ59606.1 hypothetical protein CLCHR_33810 [Clostridium chromiireducens]